MNRYVETILRHRWWVIGLSLLLTLVIGVGLKNVRFSDDARDFFARDDPLRQTLELVQNAYANDRTALVAFAPAGGDVFETGTLAVMQDFTERAWRLPHVRRVDSLTNFQHVEARPGEIVVRDLVKDASALMPQQLAALRKTALSEPLLVKRLVSPSGHVAAVAISVAIPGKSSDEKVNAVKALRSLVAEVKAAHPEIAIHTAGELLLDHSYAELAQQDVMTLAPLMYAFIFGVMFIALRSLTGVAATLLVLTFALIIAVGASGLLGIKLTAVSVTAPTILMTITVANCMHMVLAVLQRMGRGESREEAVRQAMHSTLPLTAVACGTDVLGFFTMCLSDVPPFVDFGIVLGIGSLGVFVLSATLLPALVAVLPLKGRATLESQGLWLGNMAARIANHRWRVFAAALVVNGVAGWFLLQNRLEDNFVDYVNPKVEFRRDADFISEQLTGVHEVLYSVPAAAPGGVATQEYLNHLARLTDWLRQQPEVFNVTSLSDVVKRINRTMSDGDPAAYSIPAQPNAAAQMLQLFEMSLPPGLELTDQIRIDRSASKLTVIVRDIPSTALIAFDERVQAWMRAELPAYMAARGTGLSLMFSQLGKKNVASTLQGYALQILLISVVIGVLLRSVRLGAASIIPNVIPSLLAFGIWGGLVGHVGLSVAVVAVLTYGIIVDDTIHSIFKYHHARTKLGLDAQDAIRHTYSTAGLSVLFTALVLIIGFCALTLSNFDLNADLGVMSALTIGIAALVDLLLLPPLLFAMDGRRQRAAPRPLPLQPAAE